MKRLLALTLVALVALGSSFHVREAKAHGVDGYAIADGVLGIIGGAIGHRYPEYYGYSYYPQYVPRYYRHRHYRPRHYRRHYKHYRRHYKHHRRHHH